MYVQQIVTDDGVCVLVEEFQQLLQTPEVADVALEISLDENAR